MSGATDELNKNGEVTSLLDRGEEREREKIDWTGGDTLRRISARPETRLRKRAACEDN